MTPWARLTLPLATILLGACSDPLPEVVSTSDPGSTESSTGEPPPPTTTATTPGEDTLGTMGGTGMETTMGAVDTTTADPTTTSSDETTAGVGSASSSEGSTGEPPPRPECMNDGECANSEVCDGGGNCVSACMPAWGMGNYGACINEFGGTDIAGLCGGAGVCIVDNYPINASTCSRQSCVNACDCPPPPDTGNATVMCANITGDGITDCYLSCAGGATCPDGLQCYNNVCMAALNVNPVPIYGNCGDIAAACAAPGFCFTDGFTSVCQRSCSGAGDCPAAPPTGNAPVTCGLANAGVAGPECYLSCSGGQTCPVGMYCYDGFMCAFP